MSASEHDRPRVLAIGMDAAEATLVLRWAREGRLPALGELIRRGCAVELESPGRLMPEAAWPSLITGCGVGKHGTYNWRVVKPGTNVRVRHPRGTRRRPFWWLAREEARDGSRPRAIVVDIPFTSSLREDGVTELLGWGQRGAARRESWPPGLLEEVIARHGAYPAGGWLEVRGRQTRRAQRRRLAALERLVDVKAGALEQLIRARPWELCVAMFSESHWAGHAFHRYLCPGTFGYDSRHAAHLHDALERVYRRLDAAIGRLAGAAGAQTDVLVFSGFGLRPNSSSVDLLSIVMRRLGYEAPSVPSGGARRLAGLHGAARRLIPAPVKARVRARVGYEAEDRMSERVWLESRDWSRTRAFAESEPGSGWVRVNLRGREEHGIVDPEQRDALLDEIEADLRALTDPADGSPAVAEVLRVETTLAGPHTRDVPDLVVRFSERRMLDEVCHPRAGLIRDPLDEVPVTEHTGNAFLIAAGPGIRPGARVQGARLEDVAPTVLHLLGAAVPDDMDGRPLTGLLDASTGRVRTRQLRWDDDPWAPR